MSLIGQAGAAQPWGSELDDNFIFVRSLPWILGLGVAYGLIAGWLYRPRIDPDGVGDRFALPTGWLHLLIALGFVLALPTGLWQYMGGILDVQGPLPVYWYYRIHYIGASIVLASVMAFLTYWWMAGDRSLVVPRGEWGRYVRGIASEVPPMVRAWIARIFRVDPKKPAGSSGVYTFYEKTFMFPAWTFGIALITVTGLIKLIRYALPVPGLVLWGASTLHVAAMVLLIILTLDHLRYYIARVPRLAAVLTLLWCVANIVVAFWMVQGAFVAKTAQHEGILAQAALLLGGLLVAVFAVLLARQSLRALASSNAASGA